MALSLAALAAISAIPGIAQAGIGLSQNIQANKLRKEYQRPEFKTPEQIKSSTELARRSAGRTKLPGQDIMEQALASRTASGVSALKEISDSPVDAAAGVTKLVAGEQRAVNELNISAQDLRQRNEARLMGALGVEAGYELEGFRMNEFEPYVNAMRTAAQLSSSGTQNIFGGIDSAASGALGTIGQNEYLEYLKSRPTQWDAVKKTE